MNLFLSYKKAIFILIASCLLIINHNVIMIGLDSNLFGILCSIIIFAIGGRRTTINVNYPLFALIFILEFISYRLHTKSVHFVALALFFCLMYYNITQKFSFIAFISILLFSSIFNTFFDYLTTEIKQSLCYNVYAILKNFIPISKIEGVNFYLGDSKIAIDTACMGLSMFKTGLLSGAFLLTFEEKKHQKYFSIFQIFLFCMIVVVLNIISNYFRIITLILFNCTEENTLHHTIGILCFVFYQIAPMLFIVKFFKPKKEEIKTLKTVNPSFLVYIGIFLVLTTSLEINNTLQENLIANLNSTYQTKNGIWINNEVFKISAPNKLTYIKTPSHNPLVCWTGSGYKIIKSAKINKGDEKIWMVKMEKNNIKYDSFWWYECDKKKYTSLPEVLLIKLFYNKPVCLINETSRS